MLSNVAAGYHIVRVIKPTGWTQTLPVKDMGQHITLSSGQNITGALSLVNGEFVGVFDADHHPDSDAFRRAWRWLAGGYDVVQGHCVVRNGDTSWVAHGPSEPAASATPGRF